jgi:formamidase
MSELTIAIVQSAPPNVDPDWPTRRDANLAALSRIVEDIAASRPTVDLIVFPEYYVAGCTGFIRPPMEFARAESLEDGPAITTLKALARRAGKWLVPGSLQEISDVADRPYNAALLISPEGEIVLHYRKVFIPHRIEQATAGSDFPVYDMPGVGKIGLVVCADTSFPESVRNVALQGAEIVIRPNAQSEWMGGLDMHTAIARVRAFENQLYFVDVNMPGPQGVGDSLIVDPLGRIVERLGPGESWTVVDLDLEEVRRVRRNRFRFLQMLGEASANGVPFAEAYADGVHHAPVMAQLGIGAPA